MPALPPYIIEPIFEQFLALLPERETRHPLGCHRSRIPDQGGLREGGRGAGVRLRLLREDRRRNLLGHHAQGPTRRVDRTGGDGRLAGLGPRQAYDRFVGLELLLDVAVETAA